MKNSEYWKERMQALEEEQYQRSARYYKDLQEQYDRARRDMEKDIAVWYQRLADNNGISYAEAKRLLEKNELKEFQWSIKQYIKSGEENAVDKRWMKELENASAKYHISRLEAIKMQLQHHIEQLSAETQSSMKEFLRSSYEEQYYHTAFEIAKGTEVGSSLMKLDTRRIDAIIGEPWAQDGQVFSDRIWANKNKLVNNLHTELVQNIIRGTPPKQATDNLAKIMNVGRSQAGRLVMTESAAIASKAQQECFKELGVEKYEIVATLDNKTSEICQEMDGKVFDRKDYQVGLTAPPFHPWCRSTTVPYFNDEFTKDEKRAARDEETGETYYVPADMTYKEWKKKYVSSGLSTGNKINEGIPEHNKPVMLENVDFADKNVVLSKIREYEEKIVNSPIENAVVICKDGNIHQCFGDLNGVYPDNDLGEMLNGAIVTHNHPIGSANEYSFSASDINLFMESQLELLRGIDERYIYVLTRNPADIDEHMSIFDLEEEFDARHEIVIDIAKQYGLGYRRWKRE